MQLFPVNCLLVPLIHELQEFLLLQSPHFDKQQIYGFVYIAGSYVFWIHSQILVVSFNVLFVSGRQEMHYVSLF